ncbi:MAG: twin-arginine translocase subunit TatC [Dehalococcoidia bacterium]
MTTQAPPIQGRGRNENPEKVLSVIEHLEELRNRVMWAAGALVLGIGVSVWPLTGYAIEFLMQPGKDEVEDFKLHQFQLLDYWSTYFRVSLLLGLAIAMPMIMYQLLAFVSPAMTKHEKRWLYPLVAGASVMFIIGMAFAYYVELPPALDFLLNPATDDVEPTIGIKAYIDTVTRLLLITGLVFQLPFVIMALAKIGVVNSKQLIGFWRYAVLLAVVAAAIVTPSIDPITQTIVALPIVVLYGAGTLMAKLVEGNTFIGSRRM